MAKKAKNDANFCITCSHCTALDFKLTDVKPGAPVRVYTDTPYRETAGKN